jgi:ribosomal protein L11 methyltransferase
VNFKFVEVSVDVVKGSFSVVVSNIEKHHLEPLLPQIYEKTEEFAVLSGILKSQSEEFKRRLKEVGFKLEKETGEGEWTAYLVRK